MQGHRYEEVATGGGCFSSCLPQLYCIQHPIKFLLFRLESEGCKRLNYLFQGQDAST